LTARTMAQAASSPPSSIYLNDRAMREMEVWWFDGMCAETGVTYLSLHCTDLVDEMVQRETGCG